MRRDHRQSTRNRHTITRPSPSLPQKERSLEYVLKAIVFFSSPHSFPLSAFISITSISSSLPSFSMVSFSFSGLQSDRLLFFVVILVRSLVRSPPSAFHQGCVVSPLDRLLSSPIVSFILSFPYFYDALLLYNTPSSSLSLSFLFLRWCLSLPQHFSIIAFPSCFYHLSYFFTPL